MPRQARLDVPGALHHIVRGINKANIFDDDQDRSRLLERLGDRVTQGRCTVYAWALMSNHVHILFKEELDRYPWSDHRTVLGKAAHSWMDVEYVLAPFGDTRRKALPAYRAFMGEGVGQRCRADSD